MAIIKYWLSSLSATIYQGGGRHGRARWLVGFTTTYANWISGALESRNTTLCDKICQGLATGHVVFYGYSNSKANRHDIADILLKVA